MKFLSKNTDLTNNRIIYNIFGIRIKRKINKESVKNKIKEIELLIKNNKDKNIFLLQDYLGADYVECIDAYSLFLYLKSIDEGAYYICLKSSNLYKKLSLENKLDGIIGLEKNTKESTVEYLDTIKEILAKTKFFIVSFDNKSNEFSKFCKNNKYFTYIFLQHGVCFFKESVFQKKFLSKKKFNKYLISNEKEKELFITHGFKENSFIKAGLPRWDLLKIADNEAQKEILIMFTFRNFKNKEIIENSIYKQNIEHLINNADLIELLKEKNIKLNLSLHHMITENKQFEMVNDNINLISPLEVSQYIKNSSLLITDFSSVAFDFMFLNKPIIFYLLDYKDKNLHKFDREDMEKMLKKSKEILNIYLNETDVITKIQYYIENNFNTEPKTLKLYNEFFYTKENIRKKIIDEIKE